MKYAKQYAGFVSGSPAGRDDGYNQPPVSAPGHPVKADKK